MKFANRFFMAAGLLITLLTGTATAAPTNGLTKVERPACLFFPQIIDFKNAGEDVHYTKEIYSDCDDRGNHCIFGLYITLHYTYQLISNTDYYSAVGKLVTTNITKVSSELTGDSNNSDTNDDLADKWVTGKAELRKKISKEIYRGNSEVCSDSFYKN